MAFENVNVSSLKNAINSCINSINYSTTQNIINNISNNNVWQTESRNNLKRALETLKDNRYKELKNYLNNCLKAVGYIELYKTEEAKISRLQLQINELQTQLNSLSSTTSSRPRGRLALLYGEDGNHLIDQRNAAQNNAQKTQISNKITNLKRQQQQCRREMENLESKVSNCI